MAISKEKNGSLISAVSILDEDKWGVPFDPSPSRTVDFRSEFQGKAQRADERNDSVKGFPSVAGSEICEVAAQKKKRLERTVRSKSVLQE